MYHTSLSRKLFKHHKTLSTGCNKFPNTPWECYRECILSVALFFLLLFKHLTKKPRLLRYKILSVEEGKKRNSAVTNGITNAIRILKIKFTLQFYSIHNWPCPLWCGLIYKEDISCVESDISHWTGGTGNRQTFSSFASPTVSFFSPTLAAKDAVKNSPAAEDHLSPLQYLQVLEERDPSSLKCGGIW